jgi:hypothetical protein
MTPTTQEYNTILLEFDEPQYNMLDVIYAAENKAQAAGASIRVVKQKTPLIWEVELHGKTY